MSWFQVGIAGWIYQNCPERFRNFHRPSSGVVCMSLSLSLYIYIYNKDTFSLYNYVIKILSCFLISVLVSGELLDEFTKIFLSAFGLFIGHHQGLFACIKSVLKEVWKLNNYVFMFIYVRMENVEKHFKKTNKQTISNLNSEINNNNSCLLREGRSGCFVNTPFVEGRSGKRDKLINFYI